MTSSVRRSSCVRSPRLLLLIVFVIAAWSSRAVFARSVTSVPPLAAPSGAIVNVSTEAQLQAAVASLASNTTIVLAPGTYRLTKTLWISGTFSNVGIRGATNNRDDVVLVGPGMTNANYGNVPFGIWTGGNVQGVTIANLTIRDLYQHPIIFNGGTQNPRVYNVHLIDAGQQFLKSNPDTSGVGASNGDVEYSILEYTTTAASYYTNAIDIHGGANWIIRNNLFRNIVAPAGQLAGPAILAWDHSSGTLTEGNTFLNCARGIAYGLVDASGNDHQGGVIRNNMFYRSASQPGDVPIQVADSPNTQVLYNTVLTSGTYPYAIEYRFSGTTGVVVTNNLLDGTVLARDGARGTAQSNVTSAASSWFVNAAAGDLHLKSTATSAIDRGVAVASVTDDWDGDARPSGPASDIGADEYAGTTSTTTYTISGHVRTSGGAAVSGVTVALSGAATATQTTDTAGAYSFASLTAGASYTATPSKSGYTMTPSSRTYSGLSANQPAADFTAAVTTTTDTTRPTVSMTAPAGGATVTGTSVTVSANASDNVGVAGVQFKLDGANLSAEDTASPYSITWNTTTVANGTHTLTATARDAAGNSTTATNVTVTVSNTIPNPPPNPGPCPCSIWSASTTPSGMANDASAVELGVKFTTDTAGVISGVRFYKYAQNTGTHVGNLWSSSGTRLATVTFSGESASGWQQATFAAPVAVNANTTYVVSYHTNTGYYADNQAGLTTAVDQAPLHALASTSSSPNGVFLYGGSSGFPNQTWNASNYFVDVVFTTGASGPPSTTGTPTVSLTSPATGTSYLAPITITLSATASTTSGSISKVEFFNGATLLATDSAAPYTSTWPNVGAGTYTITARATSSSGATATSNAATVTVNTSSTPPPPSGSLLQKSNLVPMGTFRLPTGTLGSTWGFGSGAGCCGLGTYGVTFNAARNSLYIGGHPYEQRLAEIAIPASFTGSPVATALSNLIDPVEGRLGSINPSDPNTKIVGGALVYNGRLIVSGYSYYDGAATQNVSTFARPTDLNVRGQVVGPVKVGNQYPGWVDKYATLIPAEWQAVFGAPAFAGGAGGAINSLQSWGPSLSAFDPDQVGSGNVPATLVLGYPYGHPLANTSVGNAFWSEADVVTGAVAIPGTRSVLFFGKHGMGAYCYGPGAECGDLDDSSKGTHAYPYRSQVWAYDLNDLVAVKNGQKLSYDVKPYATWELDASFKNIQGAAFDPTTRRLFVSQVEGDPTNSGQPLIRVYQIQ